MGVADEDPDDGAAAVAEVSLVQDRVGEGRGAPEDGAEGNAREVGVDVQGVTLVGQAVARHAEPLELEARRQGERIERELMEGVLVLAFALLAVGRETGEAREVLDGAAWATDMTSRYAARGSATRGTPASVCSPRMSAAPVLRSGRPARTRRRLDGGALWPAAVGVALVWAAVPMVVLVYHTLRHGGVLTGTDSPLPGADQLFYMDSIRQSGTHLLIADHFDLVLGRAVFLHPLYLLAGIVWRLGVPLQAAFWALSLLAAPALALGALALGRGCLHGRGERAAAVAVGVFYMSPLVPLLAWSGAVGAFQRFELETPAGESMPAWQLWGYPHSAVAVGLLALALAGAASIAAGAAASRRRLAWMAAAAALAAWLHPWQGAIFIAVAVVLAALSARSWALGRALAVPVLAAVAPIAYEEILVHTDAAWRLDSVQNVAAHVPLWMLPGRARAARHPRPGRRARAGSGSLANGPRRVAADRHRRLPAEHRVPLSRARGDRDPACRARGRRLAVAAAPRAAWVGSASIAVLVVVLPGAAYRDRHAAGFAADERLFVLAHPERPSTR